MANIIFNVGALICEAPIVTGSQYTNSRYTFLVSYTTILNQLLQFDPTANVELSIAIYENTGSTPVLTYQGVINSNAPSSATDYPFNVLDYTPNFSSKFILRLTIKLTGDNSCNETTTYQFPVDYP